MADRAVTFECGSEESVPDYAELWAGVISAAPINISPEAIEALPTLEELGVTRGILEAAEAYCASPGGDGIERDVLINLLRLVVASLRDRGLLRRPIS